MITLDSERIVTHLFLIDQNVVIQLVNRLPLRATMSLPLPRRASALEPKIVAVVGRQPNLLNLSTSPVVPEQPSPRQRWRRISLYFDLASVISAVNISS